MRLILIRHGQPEWRLPRCLSFAEFQRLSADYAQAPLAEEGREAIAALAQTLPPALILSSDLRRARETAEILNKNQAVELDPVFRELQSPHLPASFLDKIILPPKAWSILRWLFWLLEIGGLPENRRAAWRRAASAADKIIRRFETAENIILVSHGWFMILLALYLRRHGLIARGRLIPKTGYGAVTEYVIQTKRMRA